MVQEIYFSGTCKWAKIYPENKDEKYDRWTIDMYLDDKSWQKYRDCGLELKVREDEDGEFVKFARKGTRLVDDEPVIMDPPAVLNAEGESITDLVGNGSKVTIRVTVYDSRMGKGHRMEAVRVDDLVEFEGVERDEDVDGVPF